MKKWLRQAYTICLSLVIALSSVAPAGVVFGQTDETAGVPNALSTTGIEETDGFIDHTGLLDDTADWVFDDYPEVLVDDSDIEYPDTSEQPVLTEEDILAMQWDQLTAHAVVKINELFERRTIQIASFFYTNLQKLLSIDEINETYDWSVEDVMWEIEELDIDQYNHLIKYAPVAGFTHKKWKRKKDNGNPDPGNPPSGPPGQGEGGDDDGGGNCGNDKDNGNAQGCDKGNKGGGDKGNGGNNGGNKGGDKGNGNGNGNGKAKSLTAVDEVAQSSFDITEQLTNVPPEELVYTPKDFTNTHWKSNTDNPVDELYRAANLVETDLVLKGKQGMDLVIQRRYNSLDSLITQPSLKYKNREEAINVTKNDDVPGPFTLGAGWSFNFPMFEESNQPIEVESEETDIGIKYKLNRDTQYDRWIRITLDDGSTFEGGNDDLSGPIRLLSPYSGVSARRYFGGEISVTRDGYYYHMEHESDYLEVRKVDPYGNTIIYRIPDGNEDIPIEIIDSVGRIVIIEKNDKDVITDLKVYEDASRQKLLKHIRYHVEQKEMLINPDKSEATDKFYQLSSVEEVPVKPEQGEKSKTIASYTYLDPFMMGNAEFNLTLNYELPAENGKVLLDYQGIESKAYVDADFNRRSVIRYLLLDKAKYPIQGLTLGYRYSHYYHGPYGPNDPNTSVKNPFERNVVRLYLDKQALSYITYHPVTTVRYEYEAFKRNPNDPETSPLEKKWFTKDYTMTNSEVWKRPKEEIERLRGVDERRSGDRVISRERYPSLMFGRPVEKTFEVNKEGFHRLRLVKSTGYRFNPLDDREDGKEYSYNPETYLSFAYEDDDIDPTYQYTFLAPTPEVELAAQDVFDYLMDPEVEDREQVEDRIHLYAHETKYDYNRYGDKIFEQDPLGNQTTWDYVVFDDDFRQVEHVVKESADGTLVHEEQYEYNEEGYLTDEVIEDSYPGGQHTDRIERRYYYDEDDEFVLTSMREEIYGAEEKEVTRQFDYDQNNLHITEVTIEDVELAEGETENLRLTYEYDGLDRLIKQGYPDGSYVRYEYELLGRPKKETFVPRYGEERAIWYLYDDTVTKRTVAKVMPDFKILVTVYTPFGDVEYQLEQALTRGTFQRRPMLYNFYWIDGRQLRNSYPYAQEERKTTYLYNDDGSLASATNALGQETTYWRANAAFDEGTGSYLPMRAEKVEYPNGLAVATYYDRYGRAEKTVEETGDGNKEQTTHYDYNDFGFVTDKEVEGDTGESRDWEYQYDLRGNLIYLEDPEHNEYRYTYDALDNLIDVYQNDQHTTRYRYNVLSWKLAEEDLLNDREESYRYTVNGNVDTYTDKAGQEYEYDYTPYYEVEELEISDRFGDVVYTKQNEYDPSSRLLVEESDTGGHTVRYRYDPFHRMTQFTALGHTYRVKYQNDPDTINPYNLDDLDDLVDGFVYSDGTEVEYEYDELGRLERLNSPLTGQVSYDYDTDEDGETVTTSYPNGISMEAERNSFGETLETTHSNGWDETNVYDDFGNIAAVLRDGQVWTYQYDEIDRIVEEANPGEQVREYQYDGLGNRKRQLSGEFPMPTESWEYEYDALNRLIEAEVDDTEARYTYYPNGLRATKTVEGETTQYVYFKGRVVEELDASGRIKAQNVYGNQLVLRKDAAVSGKSGFYLYNSHGDVMKVVDKNTGRTLNEYQYDAWGNPVDAGHREEMSNPFRYAGEVYDEETGMYYLRARYYDPRIGRFVTEDTYKGQVDNPLTLNRYTYVHNNPLRYVDPSGHRLDAAHGNGGINKDPSGILRTDNGKGNVYWEYYDSLYELNGSGAVPETIRPEYTGNAKYDEETAMYIEMALSTGGILVNSAKQGVKQAIKGTGKFDNGWDMPRGGTEIGGRRYSEHALERMAPDTIQVRAELEKRALEKGLKPGTKEFKNFVDPRGIPPMVVEDTIKNVKPVPGNRPNTLKYDGKDVTVITNTNGDVITVIPK
ncbi:hypothetical protein LOK74_02510 [Brevibacillus humidisoli]|uniref:RHS repeat domain-containing protein n=1 Tax=Brevibacillus humidisoli TaxID=2895522 RepID=UPI001E2FE0B9|nr:RHS repeat-associated core domain-containing protein [Brevibacillus humidisoli]UFJ41428.1 hypothetical protein LOK74_02510 [Brevibacillus humidisoli]